MLIGFRNFSDNPAWIADGNRIVRNIFYYNASSADDHIAADRHARHYLNARADPDIIADSNGIGVFQPLISALKIDRMTGCVKVAVRTIVTRAVMSRFYNDKERDTAIKSTKRITKSTFFLLISPKILRCYGRCLPDAR